MTQHSTVVASQPCSFSSVKLRELRHLHAFPLARFPGVFIDIKCRLSQQHKNTGASISTQSSESMAANERLFGCGMLMVVFWVCLLGGGDFTSGKTLYCLLWIFSLGLGLSGVVTIRNSIYELITDAVSLVPSYHSNEGPKVVYTILYTIGFIYYTSVHWLSQQSAPYFDVIAVNWAEMF